MCDLDIYLAVHDKSLSKIIEYNSIRADAGTGSDANVQNEPTHFTLEKLIQTIQTIR